MNIKIKLLRPFSEVVGKGEIEIDFNEKSINDLLKLLVKKYPKLEKEFFKDGNELTEYICIFINDKPLSALNGVDTILKNGDEVLFFMPISGG
jgi:MoaD family protein